MSLTKKDLKEALSEERKYNKNFVEEVLSKQDKNFQKLLDSQRDKLVNYIKVRFDGLHDQINDIKTELKMANNRLNVLEEKIDQIIEMEGEDIKAAYEEIEKIKEKISMIENKLAMCK